MTREHHDRMPSQSEMQALLPHGKKGVKGGSVAIFFVAAVMLLIFTMLLATLVYKGETTCPKKCNSKVHNTLLAVSVVSIVALVTLLGLMIVSPSSLSGVRRFGTLFVFLAVFGTIGVLSAYIGHSNGDAGCSECQSRSVARFNIVGMTLAGLLVVLLGLLFIRPSTFVY